MARRRKRAQDPSSANKRSPALSLSPEARSGVHLRSEKCAIVGSRPVGTANLLLRLEHCLDDVSCESIGQHIRDARRNATKCNFVESVEPRTHGPPLSICDSRKLAPQTSGI